MHGEIPAGVEEDIIRGMYPLQSTTASGPRVQLLGSGSILNEAIAAAGRLAADFQVAADLWSVTSFTELAREGQHVRRWNLLHPEAAAREGHVERCLKGRDGPVIAATDYMRLYAEQIRPFVPQAHYHVLGPDGFGRSDTRQKLRHHFEVDRYYIVVAALESLAREGKVERSTVTAAMRKYDINPDKANPAYC